MTKNWDRSETMRGFDLELGSGPCEEMVELAFESGNRSYRLAAPNKASRSQAIPKKDWPQPVKSIKVNLEKDATLEQVLTELVQHCLDHLKANEAVVLTTHASEGVHQMRVALRRLRAALRLFKSALPKDQYRWVVSEAKWLTGELSAARAWDVLADEFVAPMVQLHGEDQSFNALVAAVEQARLQSRQRARNAIRTERYAEFLSRSNAWLSGRAWREQAVRSTSLFDRIGDHCTKLLQKRERSVRRQGRDIEGLSEEALHNLRLAVKRLRYSVDFFESLYPKKQVTAYRKRLTGLQGSLGYLNDVAAADTLLRNLALAGGEQEARECAYASGVTVGWHRHVAIETKDLLAKDMAAFMRANSFWRGA